LTVHDIVVHADNCVADRVDVLIIMLMCLCAADCVDLWCWMTTVRVLMCLTTGLNNCVRQARDKFDDNLDVSEMAVFS